MRLIVIGVVPQGWWPVQFQRVSLDAAGAGIVSEFSEQAPEFFRIAI
jgi:hypothetical protein